MKIRRLLAVCAALWLMCSQACAENSFYSLCIDHGITSEDACAWLESPDTGYAKPVMRHPEDDAYYASHDARGNENAVGTLYMQPTYNAADFSDPVTLVYGSSTHDAAPLGMLQEWFSGSFDKYRTIYLHLPQKTREYTVFAALPYSSIHVLHYYDFRVERRYTSFFDSVFSTRALGMHLDEDNHPTPETDHVLILSTSLRGDKTQRYLVMAKYETQQ